MNAIYAGKYAVPFAIDNHSFNSRVRQAVKGWDKEHNVIYDQWYGNDHFQAWILSGPNSANYQTIRKVKKGEL